MPGMNWSEFGFGVVCVWTKSVRRAGQGYSRWRQRRRQECHQEASKARSATSFDSDFSLTRHLHRHLDSCRDGATSQGLDRGYAQLGAGGKGDWADRRDDEVEVPPARGEREPNARPARASVTTGVKREDEARRAVRASEDDMARGGGGGGKQVESDAVRAGTGWLVSADESRLRHFPLPPRPSDSDDDPASLSSQTAAAMSALLRARAAARSFATATPAPALAQKDCVRSGLSPTGAPSERRHPSQPARPLLTRRWGLTQRSITPPYSKLLRTLETVRSKLPQGQKLTLAEKILYSHLHDAEGSPAPVRGETYLKCVPIRYLLGSSGGALHRTFSCERGA